MANTENFDYIILGGGTAGCVLANRLTENGKYSVLVLEGGGEGKGLWVSMPVGFTKLLVDPKFNWRFSTIPEDATQNRVISIPRGKGLGGSSLINGMIYVRGQALDYNGWAQKGARGWGFDDVLPYFKKLENFTGDAGDTRNTGGPINVTTGARPDELADAFLEAATQAGHERNPDYNDGLQTGFFYYQYTQKAGKRMSAEAAYLTPARARSNLEVRTQAHILRIELDGKTARRAVYKRNGSEHTVTANREILLCAGAAQTPQILELSGIGNPEILEQFGIPVTHALKGVGENYQDHYATRMNWRVTKPITLNENTRGLKLAKAVLQYFTKKTGILTYGSVITGGFIKTRPELEDADIQIYFMPASYGDASTRILDKKPGLTVSIAQLRPESCGSIHIQSSDPMASPAIRPNFLATQADRDTMIEGMKIARKIMEQPAIKDYLVHEISPGKNTKTDEEWLEFLRSNGQTTYHITGTARMGEDDMAVVNSRLKVHGLEGLRVVDASVMPAVVSGNTQTAVYMIAEKAADMILEDARA